MKLLLLLLTLATAQPWAPKKEVKVIKGPIWGNRLYINSRLTGYPPAAVKTYMGADHCTLKTVKACQIDGELCSVDLSFENCAKINAGNVTCWEDARCNEETISGKVSGMIGVNSMYGDFISGFRLKQGDKKSYSFGRVTGTTVRRIRKKKGKMSFGFT